MSIHDLYRRFAEQNAWANHRLANAVAQLDDAAYRAPRTSFFPSLHLTLAHILYVDRYYLDALEDGGVGRRIFDDEDRFTREASFARVRDDQRAADRRVIDFVLRQAGFDRRVRIERADHVAVETTGDVLLHMFQHSIHHRGQVHAMLAGTAVAPPQLDEYFLAEDLPRRAAELAELGLPDR